MRKFLYHFLRIQGAIQKFFLKISGEDSPGCARPAGGIREGLGGILRSP